MTTRVFYNPDLVEQLAACGITARRRSAIATPLSGFVVGRRDLPRARDAVTNVIAVRGGVTITGPRQPPAAAATTPASVASNELRTSLELVDECARLRRDNFRLSDEVARLRSEVDRLRGPVATSRQPEQDLDDSARRFALLELDL